MSFLPLAWCKLDVNRPGNPRRIKSCLGWRSRWVVWCLLSRPLAFCWSRVCLFSFQNKTCLQCNSWKKHRFEDEDFFKPDAGKSQDWNLKPGYNLVFPKSPTIKLPNPLAVPVGMSKDPCHERSDLLMQDFGIFQPSTFRDLGQRLIFLASRGSSATINARPLVDDSEKWIRFPTQKLAIWWCVWSPL